MKKQIMPPSNCLIGGCAQWFVHNKDGKKHRCYVEGCGFDEEEDARRKKIPLSEGAYGIRRKHIKRRSKEAADNAQ